MFNTPAQRAASVHASQMYLACTFLLFVTQVASAQVVLKAGDADMDLDRDQFDLILTLQAGKYLTGQPATWGEGDWDAAPGGEPGNPPQGDGLFDLLDIIAAANPWCQLPGPYGDCQLSRDPPPPNLASHRTAYPDWVDDNVSVGYTTHTGELGVAISTGAIWAR